MAVSKTITPSKPKPTPEQLEAQGWVSRYGIWWPPIWKMRNMSYPKQWVEAQPVEMVEAWHDFYIEREMLTNVDLIKHPKNLGKPFHFKRIVSIIFGREECQYKFLWNPCAERMVDYYCQYEFLGVAGHASSSKSQTGAMWGLMHFILDPEHTKVFVTSTTLEESKQRIWGVIEKYWREMCIFFGGEQNMPGKLVSSRGMIRANVNGVPSQLSGIALIAGGKGQDGKASTKIGFKAKKLIMIADELPLLTEEFYKAAIGNLKSNPYFQMIGIGNPTSYFDPFGTFTEPKAGWNSVDENSDGWETKEGYCIRFDGEKSPNVLAGREIYPGLLTLTRLLEYQELLGKTSGEYYRMVKGFYSPTGELDCIYSLPFIHTHAATLSPTNLGWWVSKPEDILSLDPAFTYGGDKAVATRGKVGMAQPPHSKHPLLMVEVVQQYSLAEDVMNKTLDRNEQIVLQFAKIAKEHKIPAKNIGIDATGGGAVFATLLAQNADIGKGFLNVRFSESPTENRVSHLDNRTGKERYSNRVSELWYVGRELIQSGQFKIGNIPDMLKELCSRTYKNVAGKVKVESKDDMKSRIKRSPDFADSALILLDLARQRFGLNANKNPKTQMRELTALEKALGVTNMDLMRKPAHTPPPEPVPTLSYSSAPAWGE